MRVIIEDAVFSEDPDVQLKLIELFLLVRDGRHRVILATEPCPAYNAWKASLTLIMRELVDTIRRTSLDAECRTPALIGIRIIAASPLVPDAPLEPPNSAQELTVALAEALRLLHLPLRVIVENAISDRAFLIAAARPEDRLQLQEAEDKDWLRFQNAGGLTGIDNLFSVNTSDGLHSPLMRLRAFIVFDSDRVMPEAMSKRSDDLTQKCASLGLDQPRRYYQLRRRCIENYLPIQALERWEKSPKGRNNKPAVVEAFRRLDKPLAHHYNMKGGFKGDQARLPGEARGVVLCNVGGLLMLPCFSALALHDVVALSAGFGEQIATDFRKNFTWYRDHGGWRHESGIAAELDELMDSLLGAL